jgi:N utilization substance protein B
MTEGKGRRRARRDALFALYQMDLLARDENLATDSGEWNDPYQTRIVLGVLDHKAEIDGELARHLEGWTLDRLAPLERNILRIGLFELRYAPDTPPAVAVSEAVSLAKRYCSDEAGRLVNGVLGSLIA